MKTILVGFWITIVALGSTFGAAMFLFSKPDGAPEKPAVALQSQKTRVLNVPMISDGVIQGFVSVQFVYTTDGNVGKSLPVSPEVYLLDEAFKTLYSDSTLDFRHLEKYDLGKLTKRLVESTNAHLGVPLVKDVLISDMNYSPRQPAAD